MIEVFNKITPVNYHMLWETLLVFAECKFSNNEVSHLLFEGRSLNFEESFPWVSSTLIQLKSFPYDFISKE